jgi:hypothetical protein
VSTLVCYADTSDGYLDAGWESDWETRSYINDYYGSVRSGAYGANVYTGYGCIVVGQSIFEGLNWDGHFWEEIPAIYITESFISFDTSALGSGATVSAAVLNLTHDVGAEWDVEARLRDWGSTLDSGDWVEGGSGLTLLAHRMGWDPTPSRDLINDAMPANVNKTGSTRMVLVSSETRAGSWTAGNRTYSFYEADTAGTTYDPRLTITYEAAAAISGSFSASAVISDYDGPGPTLDAVISIARTGTFAASSILKRTQTGSFSADATIKRTQSGSFSADAVIDLGMVTETGSFTADALLLRTQSGSFTADAVAFSTQTGNYAADAVVLRAAQSTLTSDAVLIKPQPGSFSADAAITTTIAGSFTAASVLLRSQSSTLTASAAILRGQSGSFSAAATIRATLVKDTKADAIQLRTFWFGSVEAGF